MAYLGLALAFLLIFAPPLNQDESNKMSIDARQFRELIVRPSLKEVGLWSPEAEELLMLTAAQESHLGTWIAQVNGPALGVYQMEPATHIDVWRYLLDNNRSGILARLPWRTQQDSSKLVRDLGYATVMARLRYLYAPEPIPAADQVYKLAAYWKQWYNTSLGAGRISDAVLKYHRYVLEKKQ